LTAALLLPMRLLFRILGWVVVVPLLVWSFGALYYDAAPAAAWGFLVAVAAAVVILRRPASARLVAATGFFCVLVWWLLLSPSHDRVWMAEYARLPWAEIRGNEVTIHEVRNFDYPEGGETVERWETRVINLEAVEGLDVAVNYWGSPWIAHPILIFRFKDAPPLAFSIETRRQEGEEYSALAGFYRQYELIVLATDERDLIGVRTNHRAGEEVYLYATTATPAQARSRLLDYLRTLNGIRDKARWYNAITTNCTTAIRGMHQGRLPPFDWRLLINGKGDEMLYERGLLRSDGLSFSELKAHALINPAAREAYHAGSFSEAIRRERPGFRASAGSE
jgi:hypothetical protein